MIDFYSFSDELQKIARVRTAVKQYRRLLQLQNPANPGSFHGTGEEAVRGILSSGRINPARVQHFGPGAYFDVKQSRNFGPYSVTLSAKRSAEEGIEKIPEMHGWRKSPGTAVSVKPKDTLLVSEPVPRAGKLMQEAQRRRLRVIDPGVQGVSVWGSRDLNTPEGKRKLMKAYAASRELYRD